MHDLVIERIGDEPPAPSPNFSPQVPCLDPEACWVECKAKWATRDPDFDCTEPCEMVACDKDGNGNLDTFKKVVSALAAATQPANAFVDGMKDASTRHVLADVDA